MNELLQLTYYFFRLDSPVSFVVVLTIIVNTFTNLGIYCLFPNLKIGPWEHTLHLLEGIVGQLINVVMWKVEINKKTARRPWLGL